MYYDLGVHVSCVMYNVYIYIAVLETVKDKILKQNNQIKMYDSV